MVLVGAAWCDGSAGAGVTHGRDILNDLDEEIRRARAEAARVVDRAQALVELRSRALAVAERLAGVPLRWEDVFSTGSERERAEARALAVRVAGEGEG